MSAYLELRRRIKAARELAGLTVTELAEEVASERLGAKAIGSLERGERKTPPQPHELAAIAQACRLPYEFFTVDFARLPELASPSEVIGGGTEDVSLPEFIASQKNAMSRFHAKLEEVTTELEILRAQRREEMLRAARGSVDPADVTEVLTEAVEAEAPVRDESDEADRGSEQQSDAKTEAAPPVPARGRRPA